MAPIADVPKDIDSANFIKSKINDIPFEKIPESLIEFWTNNFKRTIKKDEPKQEKIPINSWAKKEKMTNDFILLKLKVAYNAYKSQQV